MIIYKKFKTILNGSIELFDNLKEKLFYHGKKRKEKIIKMDHDFLDIENERIENVIDKTSNFRIN